MRWNRSSFQPTHPHGVRRREQMKELRSAMFQPTHPHGVRHVKAGSNVLDEFVSTHAPARGATEEGFGNSVNEESFNPRTRTGCDLLAVGD